MKDLRNHLPFRFNGPAYDPEFDDARLTGQILRIYGLMQDHEWRTLAEIELITGDPPASISAQLRHLRKERFGSHTVEKRPRGEREDGLWEYRLSEEQKQPGAGRRPWLRKEYKIEWIDTTGRAQTDFFDDWETTCDFMQVIKACSWAAEVYFRRVSDWRRLDMELGAQ